MNFLRALLRLFHRPIRVSKSSFFPEADDYRNFSCKTRWGG